MIATEQQNDQALISVLSEHDSQHNASDLMIKPVPPSAVDAASSDDATQFTAIIINLACAYAGTTL